LRESKGDGSALSRQQLPSPPSVCATSSVFSICAVFTSFASFSDISDVISLPATAVISVIDSIAASTIYVTTYVSSLVADGTPSQIFLSAADATANQHAAYILAKSIVP
jgi:hypothetical protein